MQVKSLLFDLGRVVIDIDFDRTIAYWSRAAGCDPRAIAQAFEANVRGSVVFGRHERAQIADAEFFADLRRSLGLDLDEATFLEGWNDIFVGEMPGIAEVLHRAGSRFPLYALSNTNPAHHAAFAVRFAPLLSHFQRLYLSHEMGMRKPEAAIYLAVAADMGVRPEEILFFDDLAENVAAARGVGMRAVQVRSLADIEAAIAECG